MSNRLPEHCSCVQYTRVSRRPQLTHKVKGTECGGARRGHALSGNWAEVDCPDCLKRRPQVTAPTCRHCRRPINGSCVHLNLAEAWLHDTCVDPFKRTPAG